MAEQNNLKLSSPKIKFSVEVSKENLNCIKETCNNLEVEYAIHENKVFKNMVSVEVYVNYAELFWLGYNFRDCNIGILSSLST